MDARRRKAAKTPAPDQKTFDSEWQRAERNRGARLFIIENWRVPEDELKALLELTGREVRLNKFGRLITKGVQMRLTAIVQRVEKFDVMQHGCVASVPTIASEYGASKRTAQRALKEAELLGVLVKIPGVHHETTTHQISWKRLFDWTPAFTFSDESGVTLSHARGDTLSRRGDTLSRRGDTLSPNSQDIRNLNRHSKPHGLSAFGSEMPERVPENSPPASGGWKQPISRARLANPEQIETLFAEACLRGWVDRSQERMRLRFYSLAAYCCRKSRPGEPILNPGALFTSGVMGGNWDWPANEDERIALAMLRPPDSPRTSNLDEPAPVRASLQDQLADLRRSRLAQSPEGAEVSP